MEEPRRTWFDARGLALGGAGGRLDLYAAELHYWRLHRSSWAACLAAIRELGFAVVSTYVPWSVHETAPGRFDFGGRRDLGGFLEEAAAVGLRVVLKPGPHINAELTHFGYPEGVLADPAMQAVSGRGTPVWMPSPPHMFPVPSYAAAGFRAAAGEWLRAVGEVVSRHRYPDGPVVAIQVDNEMQLFFRLGAFDHDYHPDAIAWWREDGGEGEPPRRWDAADAARGVAWVRWKDRYAARALGWVSDAIEASGLGGLARYHNAPPSEPHLTDLPGLAAAVGGPAGLDFYLRAADYATVRRRALYLAGTGQPLPFSPEVGVGGPPWLPPMSAADQESVTLGLLAAGVRALSFFMVVDRERWYGAALSSTGEARPPAAWLARLLAVLREVDWTRLRRRTPVALVVSRADARFAIASSWLDPLSPVVTELLPLGPAGAAELGRDRDAAEHRRWQRTVQAALDRAAVPYVLVDEGAPDAAWDDFRAVIAPTLGRVDRALWQRLHALAAAGTQVVIGPGRPERDEIDTPLADPSLPRRAGLLRPGSLADLEGLAADLAALAGDASDDFVPDAEEVDGALFAADDAPRVLFLGNRSAAALTTTVALPAGARLRDPLAAAAQAGEAAGEIRLAAHQVRMFVIEGAR